LARNKKREVERRERKKKKVIAIEKISTPGAKAAHGREFKPKKPERETGGVKGKGD